MDAQIGYEQLRYAVWTVSYSNQIPSGYAQNRIWADSLNEALASSRRLMVSRLLGGSPTKLHSSKSLLTPFEHDFQKMLSASV